MNLISILLVDDHELVRSGIARLIADQPDMKVIGEVSSGEEALQFIFHSLPAIIIMADVVVQRKRRCWRPIVLATARYTRNIVCPIAAYGGR